MKPESSVDKITRIHTSLTKKKSFRIFGVIHTAVVYMSLAIVLLTGGLFIYESQMASDDYVKLETAVSSRAEYADGSPIKFFIVANITQEEPVILNTILRCDAHNGDGMEYIGEYAYELKSSYHSSPRRILTNTRVYLNSVGETASFKIKASGIRTVIGGDQLPVPYYGALPTGLVSTCYGEHTFSTSSPIFKIPSKQTIRSYPFEYVWYNYFEAGGW